jgi:5-methylcytosine-specific restriction endonuclease McrA
MKKCLAENCNESKLFTHGYCYEHRGIYYKSKGKDKIAPRSDKRKGQEVQYSKLRHQMLEDMNYDKVKCWFCGSKFHELPELHHALGRTETLLTDEDNLKPVHSECHHAYHSASIEQLQGVDWYEEFKERMKIEFPKIFNRENNKQFKK